MSEAITRKLDIRYLWTDKDDNQIYVIDKLKIIISTKKDSIEISEDNPHVNNIFYRLNKKE